jgi:hypothetical protein
MPQPDDRADEEDASDNENETTTAHSVNLLFSLMVELSSMSLSP